MRNSLLLMALLFIWCPLAMAQNLPTVELSGGYSNYWVHDTHAHGWDASGTFNLNRWLGLDADLSGYYFPETVTLTAQSTSRANPRQYRFYAGPRYSFRKLKDATPFVHLLLGVLSAHTDYSGTYVQGYPFSPEIVPFSRSITNNSFSAGAGAGLDIRANDRIGIRIIQVDYLRDFVTGPPREVTDAIRIGVRLVVNLGRK